MRFKYNLGRLREWGRKIVLPSKSVQELVIQEVFKNKKINMAIDFGAGTLYWSRWLENYVNKVIAVDVIYENNRKIGNIFCTKDILKVCDKYVDKNTLVWMCDILHHLDENFSTEIISTFMEKYDYIVIKDINMRHKFGNFMNRMHDRIINRERIRNIDPIVYKEKLEEGGYYVCYKEMKKLWYPHFILIACRK